MKQSLKKIAANIVFSLFVILIFIGSALLNLFTDNNKYGILGFVVLAVAYLGYYWAIQYWPNPFLQETADYAHITKWAFTFQVCFGLLLMVHLLRTPSTASPAFSFLLEDYDAYANELKNRKTLGIIACIILMAPFFIRKAIQLYNS